QFSGPFKPRPADTTNSASGTGISPSGCFVEITFTFGSPAFPANASTVALPPVASGWIELGNKEIIFFAVLTFTAPKAFPENTFTLIVPSPSGNAIAPETNPAFKRTDKRGAIFLATSS